MTSVRAAIRGFYAVLDREDEALARTLASTAKVVQVRIKPHAGRCEADELVRVARMARRVCDELGAALIVNDRLDVALAVDADGVHLGQTDLPVADARRIALASRGVLRHALWIGVSTHNEAQVREACAAGADYLGFGPMFTTTTKQHPDPEQGLAGLAAAVRAAAGSAGSPPLVAIGGISAGDAAAIYQAGAHAICAIRAVNDAADPGFAARQFEPAGHA